MLKHVETKSLSPVFVGRRPELDTLDTALTRAATAPRPSSSAARPASAKPASSRSSPPPPAAGARSSHSAAASRSAPTDSPSPPSPPPCANSAANCPSNSPPPPKDRRRNSPASSPNSAPPPPERPAATNRAWPASSNSPPASSNASPPDTPSSSSWRTSTGPTPPPATSSPISSAPCAPAVSSSSPPTAPTTSTAATPAPLLAELDRLRTVQRIELGRLNREEVARQVAGIIAREPEPGRVDDIFERSDGNAFFVEELAVAADEGCRTGLTDSLRDLLLVRVEGLPERAQRVARIVAEGGSTVEDRLLAAVAGLGEDDLIEALRAAVNASILAPAPDRDGYRFRHSLVREAVSDDLLPGERSRLNRRYAQALEADPALVPADERVTRLASYWYHAHDAAKALPAVLDASVEARRRHAYSEQLGLLERAMELWDAVPDAVRATLRPSTTPRPTLPAAATPRRRRCAIST
ncbi:hypothetical protein SHKM778_19600 [Streptomyces sp. KM77-8]|uniref:DUF222 domain-containing protein n=1 Tax=Streptomyces haneummycinicus TaxID=3074435 RepID=A0AAT9HDM5_9ACTN